MASAAERTSSSWYCKPRRSADATVSFLLISAAVGCCCGAAVTVLSSRGFVWSGLCDCAGKGGFDDWAFADGPAKEQTTSPGTGRALSERNEASRNLGRIRTSCMQDLSSGA